MKINEDMTITLDYNESLLFIRRFGKMYEKTTQRLEYYIENHGKELLFSDGFADYSKYIEAHKRKLTKLLPYYTAYTLLYKNRKLRK